jgi:hypothetical protein
VSEIKFLGVIFVNGLSWSSHAKKVVRAFDCTLKSLKPSSFVISNTSKLITLNALVLSHLKYASVVWLEQSCNYKPVDNIMRRSVHYIYGLLKFDSVSDHICSDLSCFFSKYLHHLMF